MALAALGIAVYGLVFGSLAQQASLAGVQTMAMSLLVYSGSAQFVILPLLQSGASLASVALTVGTMSLRHVVMGLSLAPSLRHARLPQRLLLAYAVNDETFAVISDRIRRGGASAAFMGGAAFSAMIAWTASTWLGFSLGQVLPPPETLGLDFAFTALFIALVVPQVRSRGAVMALAVAAIVSVPLTSIVGLGIAVAVAGLLGALIGGWVER
jgi:4-azaleucine resistance transporter AzlC